MLLNPASDAVQEQKLLQAVHRSYGGQLVWRHAHSELACCARRYWLLLCIMQQGESYQWYMDCVLQVGVDIFFREAQLVWDEVRILLLLFATPCPA